MKKLHSIHRAALVAACLFGPLAVGMTARANLVLPSLSATDSAAANDTTGDDTQTGSTQTGVEIGGEIAGQIADHPDARKTSSMFGNLRFGRLMTDNEWYNWAGLLGAIFLGLLAGKICASLLTRFAARLSLRGWIVRSHVFKDLVGPAKLALLALGLTLGLGGLAGISAPLQLFVGRMLLLLYSLAVFWYAFNLVSVVEVVLTRITAKTPSTLDEQLVPLTRKALRVFLVVLGAMFIVDNVFKQDIGTWLAGLGIAGLAVSLAAQDSLKNLFGSLTILFDQPFQLGERIAFGGHDGVVEEIGFRSTKVRTATGHLVTIPNSNIVNDPVENIARRPSIRRTMNVTITYDTPREKIEQAVRILRDILEEDGIREPIHQVINGSEAPPRVYFNDFNAESLNIIVYYWFTPTEWWDFLEFNNDFNMELLRRFNEEGIEFAFPTQTLYLKSDGSLQADLAIQQAQPDKPE